MVKILFIALFISVLAVAAIVKGKKRKKEKLIPQAVINFYIPKKSEKIFFEGIWNDYQIYSVSSSSKEDFWTLPTFLIYDGKDVRYPIDDEFDEIWSTDFNEQHH